MFRTLVFAFGFLALAGCERFKSVPVSGRVTVDGKPLANAGVSFQPIADGAAYTGPGSFGFTDADGRYQLKFRTIDERPGAVVGRHMVAIDRVAPQQENDDRPQTKVKRLPAKYNDKTTLQYDVSSSGTSAADFDLQTK